jgi:hypothetical protein
MRKLLVFPFSYKNKTETLLAGFQKNLIPKTLYVAPHMSKVRDFKIRYHRFFPDSALLPISHTVKSLALNILDRYSDKRIISDVEKYLTILHILKGKELEEKFRHNLPGIALAISHLIKDVKISTADKISFEDIRKNVRQYEWKFDYNLSLLLFAINVMEDYSKFLKEEDIIDMEDLYKEAAEYIGNLTFENAIFEGFGEIPAYQKKFIGKIIQKMPEVLFSFSYDEGVSLDVRELILEKVFSFLKHISNWEEKRFKTEQKDEKIECYNFASQSEEVKGIARIINRYVAENSDVTLADIITVFPSMPSYRPVVQRIFKRYGIPCEIVPGYSLSHNSSISTLLELFTFHKSYDWGVLMNLLMSPYLHNIALKESENFSVSSRENFARSGFLMENFYSARGENLKVIRSILKQKGDKPRTLKDWVENLEVFIDKLGWESGSPEVRFSFEKVLQEMKRKTTLSAEEFINLLNKVLELVDVEEGKGSGVKVSGVQESVGLEKKLCITGGATEDNIPGVPSLEEVFIPDSLKKQMGFTDHALRIARERMDLYRLKNESETVIFTYPSKVEGTNKMKSIFLFGYGESLMEDEEFIYKGREIFNFDFSEEMFKKEFIVEGKLNISVTQLEILMKCPYRFYLQFVEKLKPYRTPEIDETPELWGTIIHSVMQKIFAEYKGKIIGLKEIEKTSENFKDEVRRGIQQLFINGKISGFYRDVLNLRSEEVYNKFTSIIKSHQGSTLIDSEYKISVELPSLHLKGKIDRIEKTPTGEIKIIDIKTGGASPPSYTEIDFSDRHNMQIPLYLWMYSRNFNTENVNGNIWHFSFKEDNNSGRNEKFYDRKKMDYLKKIEGFLEETAKRFVDGNFPAESYRFFANSPTDKSACFSCQYKGVCPYEKT